MPELNSVNKLLSLFLLINWIADCFDPEVGTTGEVLVVVLSPKGFFQGLLVPKSHRGNCQKHFKSLLVQMSGWRTSLPN